MPYTFVPEHRHARAYGRNVRISPKSAAIICAVIRNKPLTRAKRLLVDLGSRKRSLDGKYYSKTVGEILQLVESCEKNAEGLGLAPERLFVHASAHKGTLMRRRRRKSGFGSQLKAANIEVMLVERGKVDEAKAKERLKEAVTEAVKKQVREMKEKEKHIVEEAVKTEKPTEHGKEVEMKVKKDFAEMEKKGLEQQLEEMKEKEKRIEARAELAKKNEGEKK